MIIRRKTFRRDVKTNTFVTVFIKKKNQLFIYIYKKIEASKVNKNTARAALEFKGNYMDSFCISMVKYQSIQILDEFDEIYSNFYLNQP